MSNHLTIDDGASLRSIFSPPPKQREVVEDQAIGLTNRHQLTQNPANSPAIGSHALVSKPVTPTPLQRSLLQQITAASMVASSTSNLPALNNNLSPYDSFSLMSGKIALASSMDDGGVAMSQVMTEITALFIAESGHDPLAESRFDKLRAQAFKACSSKPNLNQNPALFYQSLCLFNPSAELNAALNSSEPATISDAYQVYERRMGGLMKSAGTFRGPHLEALMRYLLEQLRAPLNELADQTMSNHFRSIAEQLCAKRPELRELVPIYTSLVQSEQGIFQLSIPRPPVIRLSVNRVQTIISALFDQLELLKQDAGQTSANDERIDDQQISRTFQTTIDVLLRIGASESIHAGVVMENLMRFLHPSQTVGIRLTLNQLEQLRDRAFHLCSTQPGLQTSTQVQAALAQLQEAVEASNTAAMDALLGNSMQS